MEKELIKKFKAEKKEINFEMIEAFPSNGSKAFEPVTFTIGNIKGKIVEVLNQNLIDLVPAVNKSVNISIGESNSQMNVNI